MIYTWSNTCKEPISDIRVTKYVVGPIIGTVILKNFCTEFAPSIVAASYKSCGTPCKPARKIVIL